MGVAEAAADWLADDPDPATRAALASALAAHDAAQLAEWFTGRLSFGTAGLRGALGVGPNRMNRQFVRRVTAALAASIPVEGPVVVGYDGRRGSTDFAEETVRVLLGAGREVFRYDRVCPTPELAHAVLALRAAAGVMITASHNPPGDNGYKVYAANGAQIIAPLDDAIGAALDGLGRTRDIALGDPTRAKLVPAEVRARYLHAVLALRVHPEGPAPRVVYTPLHGVGRDLLTRLFEAAGRADGLRVVSAQAEPDGAFPTVAFPNPEEPGALDLALALAREVKAVAVIANDPDADRLAVAIPEGDGWRALTGNQVGCLLAEDLLANGPRAGRRMVATTVVSSRMLARIAAAHGADYVETLTGFKWIANAAIPYDAAGGRFVLGYEEALGITPGGVVRDKDGVSSALLLVDLVAHLAARGLTLGDALAALYRQHGLHWSGQRAITLPGREGREQITQIMARFRRNPPGAIGGVAVRGTRDLAAGDPAHPDLPRSDVLCFELADGSSVLIRPSGTEPKIKVYFEVREPMDADEPVASAEQRAAVRLDALKADLDAQLGLG